jgi:hypothetical protein
VYAGLSWSSDTTNLTINRNAHGHVAGDRVIVRNTTSDYVSTLIDSTTANSFTCSASNVTTSGSAGAYSLGFIAENTTAGIHIYAPSGDHADCQLLSLRTRTGGTSGLFDIYVPASAINGAGIGATFDDCYVPSFLVRADVETLAAVAASLEVIYTAGDPHYRLANLATASRIICLQF